MVRFGAIEARNEFYYKRLTLKGQKGWSRVWLNDNISEYTGILCRDQQTDCKLRDDSIVIRGKKYWIDELEIISHPYSLEDAKIKEYNEELYFLSEFAWPSNLSPARVTLDKHTYTTAEHAWNAVMAESNNDMQPRSKSEELSAPTQQRKLVKK